jgi:hypothetical protein
VKRCSGCKTEKPESEFHKNRSEKDGFQRHCKECNRKSYLLNKEKIINLLKEKYDSEKKSKYDKERRLKKGDQLRAYDKLRSKNKERIALALKNTALRRAGIKKRIPKWFGEFDSFVLKEAFHLAVLRNNATKIKWHVDHIEPLSGKVVSGLHVAQNIQVIPAAFNMYVKNRRKPPSIAGV